ncbi:uncharacterized protein uimc1 isoform X1 [Seriola aureovittata]|uniref:uncharacterized protein uimc1 isoform X1 n=1 Tax=Seriola aureovittata TaxID=2871759 RepID=UPI0024BDB208|nr:uncharacterized protein uimc1 isoform X1 [Seriola aureovittata]XP_056254169.1 uncharacterized protein uimc1 isoform X1 [Seriola aureovittata]XP_056254170.1 uncharacterized protein uimc1 isoform X1 [Seriola aureovittata]
MPLRKQTNKDASDIPSESQQIDESTQEQEAVDDGDDKDELSSSLLLPPVARHKRRRERENKSKNKDMTEEEMMDLALRLSEQEASDTALRLQQEEEAVMKAIQESMVGQKQPCPPSQSQSLLANAEASLRLCARRKLLYSNAKKASAVDQGASQEVCAAETDLNRDAKGSGNENNNRNKKRKRKEGSPLLEMPDLSQTQKINPQASPCSSEALSLHLDSPQSSDSTQIEDCQLIKSPVFPLTSCSAKVQVPRLSQDLLETCRSSGFVLCSQDTLTSTEMSVPAQVKSPTFPKSPKSSSKLTACPKSPVFSGTDQGDDGETELDPEYLKSPVFGRTTRREGSPSASKSHPTCENSGFMFTSQDSLTSSVRSTSCRPQSPVFPRSPGPLNKPAPPERPTICKSPVFSETDRGRTEQRHSCSTSPVFSRTGPRQRIHLDLQDKSEGPSGIRDPSQGPGQDNKTDLKPDDSLNKITSSQSDEAQEPNETSKGCSSSERELTSDMTLLWSDDDEAVTPVGSPSPVFPEERPGPRADGPAASLNHVTAASPGTTGSNGSLRCVSGRSLDQSGPDKQISLGPSSSSTSTSRQQPSTTQREPRPPSSEGAVGRTSPPPGEPADGPTVHYYWGVPFCPRGLDPDTYTQVILAQMQVYDRSLKQAQRCLLRKAEWGEPILPQPEKSPSPEPTVESPQHHVIRRRGLKLRGNGLRESADAPPAEAEEEEDEKAGGEEEEREKENKAEEEKNERGGGEGGQMDTDDCEVCPETQLSGDSTQDLTMITDAGAELRPESQHLPEVEVILRDDSSAKAEPQEEEEMEVDVDVDVDVEVDAPVDGKTEGNVPISSRKAEVTGRGEDPDVEEIEDRGLKRSTSPEPESAAVPQSPETNVDCPICQGSFPVTKIELHAAYCDGEVAVVDETRPEVDRFQASLKPRRKRTRRGEVTAEETVDSSSTDKHQEKCYICQKAVPLRDYSRHTELCIRRRASKTEAVNLLTHRRGNLLSALEQTESRDSEAGPSGSRLQPEEVIDLRDDDDDDDDDEEVGAVAAFRVSNSPIRSFTPISEATDCLIDFKKQQRGKKPSQRRR